MEKAAGILLVSGGGKVLLMRRAPGGRDHGGEWVFPGGGIEEGESLEQAARREFQEETGVAYDGQLTEWTRRIKDGVDFTTFVGQSEEFEPTLNDEHDLHKWVSFESALADPPGEVILHPGAATALKRFGMDELEVAQAIRDGELSSPQRFGNLLLVALRVTGTGASYRKSLDEFVWRDPKLYLNDHFLARCNGLEIVWQHPPAASMLNSDEFRQRIVGTSFLPYIKGDEVWTVARIRDSDAATLLTNVELSTSPGVVFMPWDGNRKVSFSDSELLIEGKPSVLDHLAITEGYGVWDKTGPKSGVESSDTHATIIETGEPVMAEERREDAIGTAIDSLLSKCDAYEKRRDSKFSETVQKLEQKEGYSKKVATKVAAKIGRESIGAHEMAKRAAESRARH